MAKIKIFIILIILLIIASIFLLVGISGCGQGVKEIVVPTPTPSKTATASPTATKTPSSSPTATKTVRPSVSPTPSPSPAPTLATFTLSDISNSGKLSDTNIKIDSSGKYHIVYHDESGNYIRYATNVSGVVSIETPPTWGGTRFSSMALDQNGKVHIGYFDGTSNVMHGTNSYGDWPYETIGPIGYPNFRSVSIAVTGEIINIGYFSTPDASVKVSSGEGISGPATWTTTSIEYDANANLWGTSLAFDNNAYSHMVFFNASTSVEVYANNTSGSWARLVIGHSTATNFQSSVAIDHNNYVHIATYGMNEVSSSGLQYFTNTSGSFVPVLVDTGNVGKQNAIAIDSNNHAHISYYDQTNHDLKYATNKNGVWQTMIVDSTGDVGYANSIAINASNEVYISYFDGTNDKLKLAIGH